MGRLVGILLTIISWFFGTIILALLLSTGKPVWFVVILLLLYGAHTIVAKEAMEAVVYAFKKARRKRERGKKNLAQKIDRAYEVLQERIYREGRVR